MKTNIKTHKKQILFLTIGLGIIILFVIFFPSILPSIRNVYNFRAYLVDDESRELMISARRNITDSISIPQQMWFLPVVGIKQHAFSQCRELEAVEIPETIRFIELCAFYNCTSLKSITLPQNVTSIGLSAFDNCTNLTSINIPAGVTEINDNTFYGCTSLKSITLPQNVTYIGKNAFRNCTNLTSINIPTWVREIQEGTFYGCTSLKSITLPQDVRSICKDVFHGCTSLTSITFPDSLKNIYESAFHGCTSLTSITFPESLKNIYESAFQECSNLSAITFQGKTNINNHAFQSCKKLESVRFKVDGYPNSLAFDDCPLLHRKKIKNTDEWWDWLIIQHFKYSGSDDSMRHSSVAFCGEEENRKALIDSHWYDVLDYGIRPDSKFWIEVLDRELRNMGIILYCSIVVDSETGELWWYLRNSRFDFKN